MLPLINYEKVTLTNTDLTRHNQFNFNGIYVHSNKFHFDALTNCQINSMFSSLPTTLILP